jgi:hypothetical protein
MRLKILKNKYYYKKKKEIQMTFAEYALAEGVAPKKLKEAKVPDEKKWAKEILVRIRSLKDYKNGGFSYLDFSDEDDLAATLIITYKVKGFTAEEDGGYNGDLAFVDDYEEAALKLLSRYGKWELDADEDCGRNELAFRLLKLK